MANTLAIQRVSASPVPALNQGQLPEVAKLVDVSRCIGCKGCEVACKEWNDLPPEETHNFGSYQSHEDLSADTWMLMRFNEVEADGDLRWLILKDQCMHCAEPGCLMACPSPGAIVQYTNGIVDFNQDACIGCGYCITGCPFDIPRLSRRNGKVYKCNLCIDRVANGMEPACAKTCPTGAIQFGSLEELRHVGELQVERLRERGFEHAALYDPQGVGGTHVLYVLPHGDQVEAYGLPAEPTLSGTLRAWKGLIKRAGSFLMAFSLLGTALHYLAFGPHWAEAEERGEAGDREAANRTEGGDDA